MLLSWCCFCCLHLLLLPDKTQVIITLFAFSKDYAKSWLPWLHQRLHKSSSDDGYIEDCMKTLVITIRDGRSRLNK
jgi:hypothetical protein